MTERDPVREFRVVKTITVVEYVEAESAQAAREDVANAPIDWRRADIDIDVTPADRNRGGA